MVGGKPARRIPWIALAILLGLPAALLALRAMDALGLTLQPCLLKELTGLPCATCGMTRMAEALAGGQLKLAFHWHPVAAALLCLSPLAALWDLHRAWRCRPLPSPPDSRWLRLALVFLFLGTWALQIVRGI